MLMVQPWDGRAYSMWISAPRDALRTAPFPRNRNRLGEDPSGSGDAGARRIFAEDETLPDREKATRIITIFRDTADNESGASARTTVPEFVAERMPDIELPTGAA